MSDRTYTTGQAGRFLGISVASLYRYEQRGWLIPDYRKNNYRYYYLSTLQAFKPRLYSDQRTVVEPTVDVDKRVKDANAKHPFCSGDSHSSNNVVTKHDRANGWTITDPDENPVAIGLYMSDSFKTQFENSFKQPDQDSHEVIKQAYELATNYIIDQFVSRLKEKNGISTSKNITANVTTGTNEAA